MKKKFFSKLLMGALLVATVSSYVSCKDYDDDIANLQSQIAAQEQAHALKTELESAKSEAAANLAAAEARLQALIDGKASSADLSAAKSELEAAIAGVKTTAEKAGTDVATALDNAAKAQAAAEGAQSTADAALEAAQAADAKITAAVEAATTEITAALEAKANQADVDAAIASVNTQLAALAAAQEKLATADDLSKAVAELEEKLQKVTETADVSGYVARLIALEEGIGALWSAVTSVSLYTTYGAAGSHNLQSIAFLNTTEQATVNFPADDIKDVTGGKQLDPSFTKDQKAVINVDNIIIRVSPTTAKLETGMVKLINSQGAEVPEDLIEEIKVEEYNKLLTRGANNGLWKLSFKLKAGYDTKELNDWAGSKEHRVLYAVAVNNTKANAADRRVISEYDLYLTEGTIYHAWNFTVNEKSVADIHNRYYVCDDPLTKTWTDKDNKVPELTYSNTEAKLAEGKEAYKTATDRSGFSTYGTTAGVDNRQNKPIMNVEIGEKIDIVFPYYDTVCGLYKPIRGFYVTLDHDFALESAPSEINAWRSYSYENVGVLNEDGKTWKETAYLFEGCEGSITINNLNGVKGDVIGFRVYAVNYDGTLYDPDGRAFYVYAGDKVQEKSTSIDVTVYNKTATESDNNNTSEAKEVGAGFYLADATDWDYAWAENNPDLGDAATATWYTPVENTKDQVKYGNTTGKVTGYSIDELFTFTYADSKDAAANKWYSAPKGTTAAVKVALTDEAVKHMQDDEEYTVVFTGTKKVNNGTGAVVEELSKVYVTIKKVMPNGLPAKFTVKAGQDQNIHPLKVYVKPTEWQNDNWNNNPVWDVANSTSNGLLFSYVEDIKPFDFADIFNGIQDMTTGAIDPNYEFEFATSDYDASAKKDRSTISKINVTTGKSEQYLMVSDWAKGQYASTSPTAGLVDESYSVPYAGAAKVNTTDHKVTATYYYREISLTKNKDTKVPELKDWTQSDEALTVSYICALNLDRFKATTVNEWARKALNDVANYDFADKNNGATYKNNVEGIMSKYFTIPYEGSDGNGAPVTINFAKSIYWDDQKTDLTLLGVTEKGFAARAELPEPSVWPASATADATVVSLADLLDGKYVKIVANSIKVNNGVDQYFTVEADGTTGIKFTPIRSEKKPAITEPLKFTLSFDIQDVFGHKKTLSFNWENKLQMAVPKGQDAARGL